MWRPPERIKYEAARGVMPTAEAAAKSLLFSPIQIGPTRLAERSWVPAMVPWRATDDGFVTDQVLDWYRRFAQGQPGAIVVEATGIRDIASGPLLRIGHDRYIPGLRKLAEAVREASDGRTRLFIQIIDFLSIRRRPQREKFLTQFLKLRPEHRRAVGLPEGDDSAVRAALLALDKPALTAVLSPEEREALDYGSRERVTDLHLDHVRTLPQVLPGLFADAAARAEAAGFDGVELHYAHAYTMASFLSATNTRDDDYGGARENRVRLPLEVYAAVRERVSERFAVGCRFLAEECITGGSTVDDAAFFAVEFARAGMDFLSTSRGGKFDDAMQPGIGAAAYPYTGPSGYECMPQYISDERGPFGRNMTATTAITRAIYDAGLKTPVVGVGGIHNFEMAETLLASGACDIIGAARQTLADPDWFRKIRLGQGDQVRICEYTNYCEALDQKHKPVTCQLWDRTDVGKGGGTTPDGKRRMTAPAWRPEG
jgi:dimethylglycine catabolism A